MKLSPRPVHELWLATGAADGGNGEGAKVCALVVADLAL